MVISPRIILTTVIVSTFGSYYRTHTIKSLVHKADFAWRQGQLELQSYQNQQLKSEEIFEVKTKAIVDGLELKKYSAFCKKV